MTPSDDAPDATLTRRHFLAWSAAATVVAACELATPTRSPTSDTLPGPTPSGPPASGASGPSASPAPAETPVAPAPPGEATGRRTLYRDGALAHARTASSSA